MCNGWLHNAVFTRQARILFAVFAILARPAQSQTAQSLAQNAPQNPHPARPGSVNYVEGQAFIDNRPLDPNAIGNLELERNQSLSTQSGKVEILLTPGVFLRLADNSSVRMISPELANTEVQLDKGRSMIEAVDIRKENNIVMDIAGARVKLLKKGLYDFDADRMQVRTFDGQVEVTAGADRVKVGRDHMVTLNTGKLKSEGFDRRQYEDDFYRWSALRSGYLSEASVETARIYIGTGPEWYAPGWVGYGWYWNPWFGAYTFIPGGGIYYGPFGWGFYSPWAVYRSPFYYYGYGYYGRIPHRFPDYHYPYGHGYPLGRPPLVRPGVPPRGAPPSAPRGGAPRGGRR